jgi:hypothetical protein
VESLEKQWVRSSMAGLMVDVRVKSVTVKGITLEVVFDPSKLKE